MAETSTKPRRWPAGADFPHGLMRAKERQVGCNVWVRVGLRRLPGLREPRAEPDTFALSDPPAAKEVRMIAA